MPGTYAVIDSLTHHPPNVPLATRRWWPRPANQVRRSAATFTGEGSVTFFVWATAPVALNL
jgi:hypothetical protein